MSLKIEDIYTQFGNYKRDITDVSTATRLQWIQQMSDYIYRNLAKTEPERFLSTQTYNITAGTNSYALPTDFDNIRALNTGLYKNDTDGNATDYRYRMTSYGNPDYGYYINSTNLILTPPDQNNTETAVLRYIPKSPVYTTVLDYLTTTKLSTGTEIVPDEYLDYIITSLDVYYTRWEEDGSAESIADFRVLRNLDFLLANIRKQSLVFEAPDVSSIY
jgi:hypothetical protein